MSNQPRRDENRVEDLHLDRVVASQPEIGPTPPDGGYGWLIVISAIIYNVTVPAVLSLYGLIILKAIREEDHVEGELMKIWDVDVTLVPVIMVVFRLLLESWCRALVKTFNMPRLMALTGLCLTVAGVLLSSYSTDAASNDHIVNIFAGIFLGSGCALTGQQTDIILTHYFRDNLTIVQRLVRMAPSLGNFLMPLLIGYLCISQYTSDAVVMIYGAVIMQNCFFLASYTRPIYIETVLRTTYNMLRDAVEDEDEVIFSNQIASQNQTQNNPEPSQPTTSHEDDATDVVVFNSRSNAKEVLDSSVQFREKMAIPERPQDQRFSSDFSTMYPENLHRFSSDFATPNIGGSYNRIIGYQELESIDRGQHPQPLYRETTVDAPSNLVFPVEVSPGSARRTASLKRNFITVVNMLQDVDFYLYTLLHMCTTYSILILGVIFPPFVSEQNFSMNIWSISKLLAVAHAAALCFLMLCIALPKTINEKSRICSAICFVGAFGFYGITLSSSRVMLVICCMLASLGSAASAILLQPLYNSTLNEFNTTATMTTANTIVAVFIMLWSLAYNYEYIACFWTASILQITTAFIFFACSFKRRR